MITGKTASGFVFAVSENINNDFRIVRCIADIESDDAGKKISALARFPELILGASGAEKLFAHVALEDGSIPSDRVQAEATEILRLAAQQRKSVKNS